MWPCADINPDDLITRDYLLGFNEQSFRSSRLAIWFNIP